MTAVVALPKGAIVPAPKPILEQRRTLGDAFAVTPATAGIGGALAIAGIAGVSVLAYRRGRDRQWTGSAVDAALGNVSGEEAPIPLGGRVAGPVEFVPPDNVRPGQVGTLIDEQANLLDVTATIVDLAVRGHLRITEIEGAHNDDYELVRTDGGKGALLPYEQELYDALFATGPDVKLSDLKYKFTSELAGVKNALYDDVVTNGWYRVRPDRTRMWWRLIGFGVTLLGVAADGHHRRGLVVRADPARGARHRHRAARRRRQAAGPNRARARRCSRASRVSAGSSTKARRTPANASPSSRGSSRTTCRTRSCSAATKKWARAFEGLSAEQLGAANWYSGTGGINTFSAFALASAMDNFDTRATGTLYASQPSSSSASGFSGGGFSGGGGGGGGGGSW